jgi:hypothetical protein
MEATTITIRCKAFSCEGPRVNSVRVDGDDVTVYDRVAKHYTNCHTLSRQTIARVRKLAAQ